MLTLDAATGRVLRHDRYAERTLGGKLVSSFFALHSGSFFGLGGKLAFMAAALAMPLFWVSGWMMYLKRRAALRRSRELRAAVRAPLGAPDSLADPVAPPAALALDPARTVRFRRS